MAKDDVKEMKCGRVVVTFIAREGSFFPCALELGHVGDCRAAGTCFKHGKYLGHPHQVPQCPQWPECVDLPIPAAPTPAAASEGQLEEEAFQLWLISSPLATDSSDRPIAARMGWMARANMQGASEGQTYIEFEQALATNKAEVNSWPEWMREGGRASMGLRPFTGKAEGVAAASDGQEKPVKDYRLFVSETGGEEGERVPAKHILREIHDAMCMCGVWDDCDTEGINGTLIDAAQSLLSEGKWNINFEDGWMSVETI